MKKYRKIYKKKIAKINCKYCNEQFIGKTNRRYCSKFCNMKMNIKRQRERYIPKRLFKLKKINCNYCDIKFIQKTPNNIYCNKICASNFHKEKHHRISLGIINTNEKSKYISFLKLRFEIFKRDNFICQYCGRNPKKDKCKLVVDHILPKSKGGTLTPLNLITSCLECNLGKRDTLLEERQINKFEIKNE